MSTVRAFVSAGTSRDELLAEGFAEVPVDVADALLTQRGGIRTSTPRSVLL